MTSPDTPAASETQQQTTAQSTTSKAVTSPTLVVKTHGATAISDSAFWAGHAIGITLVVVAIVWIFAAKGPTRKDAIKSLLNEANKKDANNSLT